VSEAPDAIQMLLDRRPAAERGVLPRAALPDRFDARAFECAIGLGCDVSFEELTKSPLVEEVGDGAYRVIDPLRDALVARLGDAERRELGEQLAANDDRPQAKILADPAAALAAVRTEFVDALDRWDVASAYRILTPFLERREHLGAISQEVRELEAQLALRDMWARAAYDSVHYYEPSAHRGLFDRFLAAENPWILQLFGPGGRGKSMFIKAAIARRCIPEGIPVARIDFDFVANLSALLSDGARLLGEIARQLARQLGGGLETFGAWTLPRSGEGAEATERRRGIAIRELGSTLSTLLGALRRPRALIVLDTTETALAVREASLSAVLRTMRDLHEIVPGIRLLLAGRYDLGEILPGSGPRVEGFDAFVRDDEVETIPLQPFSDDEARRYLLETRKLARREIVDDLVRSARGNPMQLSLLCDTAVSDPSFVPNAADDTNPVGLYYLFDRIIQRIPDPRLRWVIRWGAIPDQLDYAVLRDVIIPRLTVHLERLASDSDRPKDDKMPVALTGRDPFALPAKTEALGAEDAWAQLQAFASTSSWIELSPDRNVLRIHPSARDPLLALVSKQPIYGELKADLAWFLVARAGESDEATKRKELREALVHAFDPGAITHRDPAALYERCARWLPDDVVWWDQIADNLLALAPSRAETADALERSAILAFDLVRGRPRGGEGALTRVLAMLKRIPDGPLHTWLAAAEQVGRTGAADVSALEGALVTGSERLRTEIHRTLSKALVWRDPARATREIDAAAALVTGTARTFEVEIERIEVRLDAEEHVEAAELAERLHASPAAESARERISWLRAKALIGVGDLHRARMESPEGWLASGLEDEAWERWRASRASRRPRPEERLLALRIRIARGDARAARDDYKRLQKSSYAITEATELVWARYAIEETGDLKEARSLLAVDRRFGGEARRLERLELQALLDRGTPGLAYDGGRNRWKLPRSRARQELGIFVHAQEPRTRIAPLRAALANVHGELARVALLDDLRHYSTPALEPEGWGPILELLPPDPSDDDPSPEAILVRMCRAETMRASGAYDAARAMLAPYVERYPAHRRLTGAWIRAGGRPRWDQLDLPMWLTAVETALGRGDREWLTTFDERGRIGGLESSGNTAAEARINSLRAYRALEHGQAEAAIEHALRGLKQFESLDDERRRRELEALIERARRATVTQTVGDEVDLRVSGARDGRWTVQRIDVSNEQRARHVLQERGPLLALAAASHPDEVVPSAFCAELVEHWRGLGRELASLVTAPDAATTQLTFELSTPGLEWLPWELFHPEGRLPWLLRSTGQILRRRSHRTAARSLEPGPVVMIGNRDTLGLESLSFDVGTSFRELYHARGLVLIEPPSLSSAQSEPASVLHLVGSFEVHGERPAMRLGSEVYTAAEAAAALRSIPHGLLVIDAGSSFSLFEQLRQTFLRTQFVCELLASSEESDALAIGPASNVAHHELALSLVAAQADGEPLEAIARSLWQGALAAPPTAAGILPFLCVALFSDSPSRTFPITRIHADAPRPT
jgi:hypothetical protein